MSESRFIPNSFQVPNIYVDELFKLLDAEEKVMVMFACRRIFGWQKRSDRIAASQWVEGCDLHMDTVTSRLKSLEQFRILIKVNENNPHFNKGPEWALQLDDSLVDWQGLAARKAEKANKNKARIEAARQKAAENKAQTPPCRTVPPLSDSATPTLSDSATPYPVGQVTQNTEIQNKSISVATAPERTRRSAIEKQGDPLDGMVFFAQVAADPAVSLKSAVSRFPADVQDTILALAEIYKWPATAIPQPPAKGQKAGKYAQWIAETREINQTIGDIGRAALEATYEPCKNLSISHPAAINWCLVGEMGKLMRRREKTAQTSKTPLSKHLDEFVPRGSQQTTAA